MNPITRKREAPFAVTISAIEYRQSEGRLLQAGESPSWGSHSRVEVSFPTQGSHGTVGTGLPTWGVTGVSSPHRRALSGSWSWGYLGKNASQQKRTRTRALSLNAAVTHLLNHVPHLSTAASLRYAGASPVSHKGIALHRSPLSDGKQIPVVVVCLCSLL